MFLDLLGRAAIKHRRVARWMFRFAAVLSTTTLLYVYLTLTEAPQKSKYVLKLTAFDRPPTVGSLTKEEVLPKGNNLMILGYMRGGSSMSGQVFRDSEDDFYVYEPLIKYAPYQYLTESRFCEMESLKCSTQANVTTAELAKERIDDSIETLKHIYSCQLRELDDSVLRGIMFENKDGRSKSGKSWYDFTMCYLRVTEPERSDFSQYFKTSNSNISAKHRNIVAHLNSETASADKFRACLDKLESKCLDSKVRVTKILRLSLRLLPRLMAQFPNLKVMFIIRDPRGNINSRIATRWFPVNGSNIAEVVDNIRSLCFKMEEDVKMVAGLRQAFPGRFVDFRLEDVVTIPARFDNMFGVLNLTLSYSHKKLMNELFVARPNFETQWKTSMKESYIRMVEDMCNSVFKFYNYEKIYP